MDSNIAICGLSAAGKTKHAQRLANELGYRYVSGTGTLARMMDIPINKDPPDWIEIADDVERVRTDDTDLALEEHLVQIEASTTGQVFDVWALPWTSASRRLVRVWLESTPQSRAMKCFVSQGFAPSMSVDECLSYLARKDADNRALFRRTQGFDLVHDHDVFQVVLDNTSFIEEPTEAAANRGIAAFAPFVRTAIEVCRGKAHTAALSDLEASCAFAGPVVSRCAPLGSV
jgi:cytidylate kinase